MKFEKKPSLYIKEEGDKKELEWLQKYNNENYMVKASGIARILAQIQAIANLLDGIHFHEDSSKKRKN